MASIEEIRAERIKKIRILEEAGMDPYPVSAHTKKSIANIRKEYKTLEKAKKSLWVAGRVFSLRGQGAIMFVTINDGTDAYQVMLRKDEMKAERFQLFKDTVDIGDYIECRGTVFTTKRKEQTVLAKDWTMLTKSLRSLPDKWHGLQDVEERFRKRYLDTLMSEESKERFIVRSKLLGELRAVLNEHEYMEVETPMLQHMAGGASALPFVTHHNALDIDLYLRIAPELYLKKLLVGGFPKVYEIGRNFRNEGIDVTHNPEFTMLEFYESYSDAKTQMVFVEKMFKRIVKNITKKTSLSYDGKTISFTKKFTQVKFYDLLKRYALIGDPGNATKEELALKATQLGVEVDDGDSREKIMDNIYKKTCRPKLIQPTFITNYPLNYLPLAKKNPDAEGVVDAFQLIVGGVEIVKAFSELNDPLDQAQRFKEQDKKLREGDAEAQASDVDFIETLEHGMPPAGGVGVGIDRLAMLLTDSKNIKEVILFPTMRPKE